MKKETLGSYLYKHCYGKEKDTSAAVLERSLHCSGNELRRQVNRLRCENIPIASDSNGYYFAANAAELYATIRSLERMRHGLDRAIDGLEKSMSHFEVGN